MELAAWSRPGRRSRCPPGGAQLTKQPLSDPRQMSSNRAPFRLRSGLLTFAPISSGCSGLDLARNRPRARCFALAGWHAPGQAGGDPPLARSPVPAGVAKPGGLRSRKRFERRWSWLRRWNACTEVDAVGVPFLLGWNLSLDGSDQMGDRMGEAILHRWGMPSPYIIIIIRFLVDGVKLLQTSLPCYSLSRVRDVRARAHMVREILLGIPFPDTRAKCARPAREPRGTVQFALVWDRIAR